MFTAQHYDAVSKLIRSLRISTEDRAVVAVTFGGLFLGDSPRFDLPRFLQACIRKEE